MSKEKKRVIAIYLPQYHPFKENDEWWGKGFTEWRNVAKARPLFKGHYQPHIPSDLGFYDLRLAETRQQQADMAQQYGIYGFCYYHYWFNGHLLMERPINEMLTSQQPEFPFMFCWANENWTRAWDGANKNVLIEQHYSFDDDAAHINYLLDNVFCDSRYIKIDGKPVFAIYRSSLFPNIKRTIEIWRTEAKKRGVELYLCRFEAFNDIIENLQDIGFDAAIEFPPHNITPYLKKYKPVRYYTNIISQKALNRNVFRNTFEYKWYVEEEIKSSRTNYKRYECVTPMWDNSPRKKKDYFILTGSTPALYQKLLSIQLEKFTPYSHEENLFFINAWNEWAEGNHLEPDMKWGTKYLEATEAAIKANE